MLMLLGNVMLSITRSGSIRDPVGVLISSDAIMGGQSDAQSEHDDLSSVKISFLCHRERSRPRRLGLFTASAFNILPVATREPRVMLLPHRSDTHICPLAGGTSRGHQTS